MDLQYYCVREETPVKMTGLDGEFEGRKQDIRRWPEDANMYVSCNHS
jgi:hypothetical protein